MLFTFTPTSTDFNLTVMIVDDSVAEDVESFSVQAEVVSVDAAASITIDPPRSTVTINDSDGTLYITVGSMKLQ